MEIKNQQKEKECISKLFSFLTEKNKNEIEYIEFETLPKEFKEVPRPQ